MDSLQTPKKYRLHKMRRNTEKRRFDKTNGRGDNPETTFNPIDDERVFATPSPSTPEKKINTTQSEEGLLARSMAQTKELLAKNAALKIEIEELKLVIDNLQKDIHTLNEQVTRDNTLRFKLHDAIIKNRILDKENTELKIINATLIKYGKSATSRIKYLDHYIENDTKIIQELEQNIKKLESEIAEQKEALQPDVDALSRNFSAMFFKPLARRPNAPTKKPQATSAQREAPDVLRLAKTPPR